MKMYYLSFSKKGYYKKIHQPLYKNHQRIKDRLTQILVLHNTIKDKQPIVFIKPAHV